MPDSTEHLALADRASPAPEGSDAWEGTPPDSSTPPPSSVIRTRKRTRDAGARIMLGLTPNPYRDR